MLRGLALFLKLRSPFIATTSFLKSLIHNMDLVVCLFFSKKMAPSSPTFTLS